MGPINDFVKGLKEKLENQNLSPEQRLLIESIIERYEQFDKDSKKGINNVD